MRTIFYNCDLCQSPIDKTAEGIEGYSLTIDPRAAERVILTDLNVNQKHICLKCLKSLAKQVLAIGRDPKQIELFDVVDDNPTTPKR